jgi:hypothetical protein
MRSLLMVDQWYYWHSSDINGPFTGKRLAEMAADGKILPDDIVWNEGVERGVPACTVTHLFPPIHSISLSPGGVAQSPDTITLAPECQPGSAPAAVSVLKAAEGAVPAAPAPEAATTAPGGSPASVRGQGGSYSPPVVRGRAVAGKGAVIVGQDGTTVKYRMKCTVCGHEDSSWRSASITRGTTRSSFFCPKCRKRREVEVHCTMS